jgi:predicted NUDIX family NTP pyrophosphohydrolase
MPQLSAGILLYRQRAGALEVFLIHPGGPFWARKDANAWSLAKGLIDPDEDHMAAAQREFREETGFELRGNFTDLGTFKLLGGKNLHVFTVEGDCNPAQLKSNTFEMEWPPRSGRRQSFPEVDRGEWFDPDTALQKITKGQKKVLEAFFLSIDPDRRFLTE